MSSFFVLNEFLSVYDRLFNDSWMSLQNIFTLFCIRNLNFLKIKSINKAQLYTNVENQVLGKVWCESRFDLQNETISSKLVSNHREQEIIK